MSRRLGTLHWCICISNPSNLEAGEVDTTSFQSSTHSQTDRQKQRQRVCMAVKTSSPSFIKPHWVCSMGKPTPAHRLRDTNEGREEEEKLEKRENRKDHTRML